MSEDMSNLIDKINNMIKNNEIPEEIKNMVSQVSNSSQKESEKQNNTDISSDNSSSENSSFPELDMDSMIKMKKIMDSLKENKDDPRSNLLKSLKPYLKESRKQKVDQYIQIFSMGKIFENFNSLGGDVHK